MNRLATVITIPPRQWVRVYGTKLELFNGNYSPVTITADLAGVHLEDVRMRIATGYDANVSMVYVEEKE